MNENLDNLIEAWKQTPSPNRHQPDGLLETTREADRRLRRKLFWRDLSELVAATFVGLFFYWRSRGEPPLVQTAGWMLLVGALGLAAFFLFERIRSLRQHRREPANLTEALSQTEKELLRQITLLRTVAWWYLLPIGGPLAFFILADNLASGSSLLVTVLTTGLSLAIVGGVFFWIYRLNQRAIRDDLQPQLDHVRKNLRQMRGMTDS